MERLQGMLMMGDYAGADCMVRDLYQKVHVYEVKISSLEEENNVMRQTIHDQSKRKELLEDCQVKLRKEIEVNGKLREACRKYEQQVTTLKAEYSKLGKNESRIVELSLENINIKKEVELLSKTMEQSHKKCRQSSENYKKVIQNLTQSNNESMGENDRLKQRVGQLLEINEKERQRVSQLSICNKNLSATNEQLKQRVGQLSETDGQLSISNKDLMETNLQLKQTIVNLSKYTKDVECKNHELAKWNVDLEKSAAGLKDCAEDLKSSNGELSRSCDELTDIANDLIKSTRSLRKEKQDSVMENRYLQSVNKKLEQSRKQMDNSLSRLQQTHKQMELLLYHHKKSNIELTKADAVSRVSINKLKKDVKDLTALNNTLVNRNNELEQAHGENSNMYADTINKMQYEMDVLKTWLSSNRAISEQVNSINDKIDTLIGQKRQRRDEDYEDFTLDKFLS